MQNETVLDTAARVFQLYASFCKISSLEVPVLCVLHGKVVGSGFALALNTDWASLLLAPPSTTATSRAAYARDCSSLATFQPPSAARRP
jgi:enoyl-CoA hydratase/carnithine racemase